MSEQPTTPDTPETDLPLNAAGTHVHVFHAGTGNYWECPLDYLPVARTRGWAPVEPQDTSTVGLFDPLPSEPILFDLTEHDVATVSAHLAEHAATTPGEVERVLGVERAGKNRKSIEVPEGFDPITGD